ncbi:hypothetical protein TSAR_016632 [Trichomalopsis sarcophagae]|uniref:Uncharacterized protein n=1 Tax=Trichomalopsis sarcophagae TaxID=543379 RepID=A0A232EMV1_9HYME|nr:hypothetical protein TSAR_016632 [Trichomalopsis sarcophagae]
MLESSGKGDTDFTLSSPIGPLQACSTLRSDNENDESCSEEDFSSSPDVEASNRAFIGRSYPSGDLVRVIYRNNAVPNEAVQCAIDARSVSESSDKDDEPAIAQLQQQQRQPLKIRSKFRLDDRRGHLLAILAVTLNMTFKVI